MLPDRAVIRVFIVKPSESRSTTGMTASWRLRSMCILHGLSRAPAQRQAG
jgi:hypothetical protein